MSSCYSWCKGQVDSWDSAVARSWCFALNLSRSKPRFLLGPVVADGFPPRLPGSFIIIPVLRYLYQAEIKLGHFESAYPTGSLNVWL